MEEGLETAHGSTRCRRMSHKARFGSMQPIPRPAHPQQGPGIGVLPGRFEALVSGTKPAVHARRRRFRRILSIIGIVRGLQLVRVKEEPRVIDQEKIDLQDSAWFLASQSVGHGTRSIPSLPDCWSGAFLVPLYLAK